MGPAILRDLMRRSEQRVRHDEAARENEEQASRAILEEQRRENERMLRPDLASPNNSEQLKELRKREVRNRRKPTA